MCGCINRESHPCCQGLSVAKCNCCMMRLVFSLALQATLAAGFLYTAAVLCVSKRFFCAPSMKVNPVHPGLQQNAVHIHGAGPTPWCQSQCNNLWGKSKVGSLNASRVDFSLKHLLCTFIRLVGGKMKSRGVMVSGLGANWGMGGLCLTPCLVHTLQIPSKGFKTRSFIFLCICALFMWFKSKALQAKVVVLVGVLSWYCRVAMLYWQRCVVLCWQNCGSCCFSDPQPLPHVCE